MWLAFLFRVSLYKESIWYLILFVSTYLFIFIYLHYLERVNTFSYTAILPYGPLITNMQSYTNVKTLKTIYKYNTVKKQ